MTGHDKRTDPWLDALEVGATPDDGRVPGHDRSCARGGSPDRPEPCYCDGHDRPAREVKPTEPLRMCFGICDHVDCLP